ncbi:hypothetical protein CPC16_010634 [Podila verticillata]|nr:hypothetical protein CPC16_010634 [Podila verticillata]
MVFPPIKHLHPIANQDLLLNQEMKVTPVNNLATKPTITLTNTNIASQDTHIPMNTHPHRQKGYGIATTTTYHTTHTSTPVASINTLILMLTTVITTQYMFTRRHILEVTATSTHILPMVIPILTTTKPKFPITTTAINTSTTTTRRQEHPLHSPTCHNRWVFNEHNI